jgi:hypothetical protein
MIRDPHVSAALAAFCAFTVACGVAPAAAKPAIGDSCLVGAWVLQHEESSSGYTYNGTPVPVSGLAGARMTLGADGGETLVFDGSGALVGTAADGRVLSITIGGSVTYHFHADGHRYTETGTVTSLPTTATIGGASVTNFESHNSPGTGTYQCSTHTLTTAGTTGVQTDTWSRP